ncbi:MAG: ATP-dependent Clp protease proteolytic subunit [Candidatus Obscuribacterales bacterium]
MDTTSNPVSEAKFVLAFGIEQQSVKDFAINLVEWSSRNKGVPLRIHINSQGGNILDAIFLREELKRIKAAGHKLTIAAYGRAASCATWLLQVADRRVIGEDSWLLIHEVRSSMDGPLSALRREVKRVEQLQDQTFGMICKRSKLTRERILSEVEGGNDWWINAALALELDLVDEIDCDTQPSTETSAS